MNLNLMLALLTITAGSAAGKDPLAEMLRKGIVEEETNQNLNAAIQSYQSVLARFDQERKTAATALFRLAECLRKQGKNSEAIAAYARVVREFPDQTKLAEQSRSHLPAGSGPRPEQATASAALAAAEARRLTRAALEAEVRAMFEQLKYEEKRYDLGTSTSVDVLRAKARLLELQSNLAAFDAELPPPAEATARSRSELLILADMHELYDKITTLQKQIDSGSSDATGQLMALKLRMAELQRELSAARKNAAPPAARKGSGRK